jgi:predicted RNase H-like nuclease (RuvC/YqgF family)
LLQANEEAYDVQMSKISKSAILTAWDRQKAASESPDKDEKDPETIDRLRKDVAAQESRMSELQENRKVLEQELESLSQTAERLDQKMRTAAEGKEHKDLIDMLVRMRALEAESTVAFCLKDLFILVISERVN